MGDLYRVLGVPRDADQDAIRTRFKALARKYHPDINKNARDNERFKEISAAYQILSDTSRRKLYDEFGESSLKPGFNAAQARQWKRAGGGFPGGGFPAGGSPGGVDLGDLLGAMFGAGGAGRGFPGGGFPGGGFPGGARPGRTSSRGPAGGSYGRVDGADVEQALEIDVIDSIHGTRKVVTQGHERLRVRIPAGVEDGRQIRLRGKGRSGANGGEPGALLLRIRIKNRDGLRRVGADLFLDVPITVSEAISGARIQVSTPTGKVWVKIPAGCANGRQLRLRGRGVALDPPGDLYLVLRPTPPPVSDPEAQRLAEALDSFYPEDVRKVLPELEKSSPTS